MILGVFLLLVLSLVAYVIANDFADRLPSADRSVLLWLIPYHWLLSIVYFLYAQFNASDSFNYYYKVAGYTRGDQWMDFYATSTPFIEWIAFPFINGLGFSYEAMMVLFAFMGMMGFFYFHLFLQERVFYPVKWQGYPLTTIFLFLPNMHFWSASFGKGSVIFLGVGMFFYALNRPNQRILLLILGGLIIYHVRPHIMLIIVVAGIVAAGFSSKGVSPYIRFGILVGASMAFFFILEDALALVGIEQEELLEEGVDLSHRANELSRSAGSGVDINNYNQAMKLFTFLYRPLFFDNPTAFGFFVSIENLFLLILTIQFFAEGGLKFLIRGDFITKTAFISFFVASVALAQISGNLGIAIRQKSQVMMLLLFVIAYFFQHQALLRQRRFQQEQERRQAAAR